MDIRRIIIIFVIAILYAIFSQLEIDYLVEAPKCENFCPADEFGGPMCIDSYEDNYPIYPMAKPVMYNERTINICTNQTWPTDDESIKCSKEKGMMKFKYDQNGCVVKYKCDYCSKGYVDNKQWSNYYIFILSALFALVAIVIGIMLSPKNPINEWIGFGMLLGGLITLFIGTGRAIGELNKGLRPIIILAELILVIYLSYKKIK